MSEGNVTPITEAPSAILANPKCRVCGIEVEVEGYAELPETYRESIDRMIVCDKHAEAEAKRADEEVRQQRRTVYAAAVNDAQFPEQLRGKKWSDLHPKETEDVTEGDRVIATAAQATETRKKALDACVRWSRGEIRGLILAGRVGMGKSWFAAVSGQSLIYQRVKAMDALHLKPIMPIRWVTVPELIQKSRGDYGSERRRDAEKILAGTSGLVLDDIDKIKPTEFALDLLLEALETRINGGRPLLVTTNLGYRELRDLLGDPITSRLRGYCEGHRMIGKDRR